MTREFLVGGRDSFPLSSRRHHTRNVKTGGEENWAGQIDFELSAARLALGEAQRPHSPSLPDCTACASAALPSQSVLELGATPSFARECFRAEAARASDRGQSVAVDGDHGVKRRGKFCEASAELVRRPNSGIWTTSGADWTRRSAGPSASRQTRENGPSWIFWLPILGIAALEFAQAHLTAVCKAAALHSRFPLAVAAAAAARSPSPQSAPAANGKKRKMPKNTGTARQKGLQRQGSASGSSTTSSSAKDRRGNRSDAAAVANRRFSRAIGLPRCSRARGWATTSLPRKKRSPIHPFLRAIHHRPSSLPSASRRDSTISPSTLGDASTLLHLPHPIAFDYGPHTHSANLTYTRAIQR